LFSKFIRFEVGDGIRIRFWHDVWCGDQPLKESFLVLFRIARNKEAWVSDYMQIMNEEAHWNVPFCRVAQDWEVEVVVTFYAKLSPGHRKRMLHITFSIVQFFFALISFLSFFNNILGVLIGL
jgi:hypothetical protein